MNGKSQARLSWATSTPRQYRQQPGTGQASSVQPDKQHTDTGGGLLSLDGGGQAAGGSASQIVTVQAHFSVPLLQILCETHWGRQVYTNHWSNWELGGTWGPIYKIPYDLSHDYRKFVVKSTYDSDLKRAEISLRNIVS